MIHNPEKLNITEEEREALIEIFKQCIFDYLTTKRDISNIETHTEAPEPTKFPHKFFAHETAEP